MEPGLIGGEINKLLAGHAKRGGHPIQYKIGPDPSSIDSCMVGGMVANNSSGMCCGVSQNTYHTLRDLRAVFADGSVLDTADPASCDAWVKVRVPGQATRRVYSLMCMCNAQCALHCLTALHWLWQTRPAYMKRCLLAAQRFLKSGISFAQQQ